MGDDPTYRSTRARTPLWVATGLAALGILVVAGAWLLRRPPVPQNIVLIVMDTLRADHLGTYGYERGTSPFLDSLAARSVLFENAMSAAPATFPSVNTLLTSVSPSFFFANNARDLGIPEEITTLAEALRAAGFRTAAVSASPIVRRSPSNVNKRGGFGQGFETFDEGCSGRRGSVKPNTTGCVTDHTLRTLASLADDKFFLYVHYLDPHGPYQPPSGSRRFDKRGFRGRPFIREGEIKPIFNWLYHDGPNPKVSDTDIDHLRDLYDGEISAVDAGISRIFDALRERHVLEDTLSVILSDHGESFMEHGDISHNHSMYQSLLHVPIIFHWPKRWHRGVRRTDLVCTIDVMPTILSLAGIRTPPAAVGVSLLNGDPGRAVPHACYAEGKPNWRARRGSLMSLRVGNEKIIYYPAEDTYEAYDLASDEAEVHDLSKSRTPRDVARLTVLERALHVWPEAEAARAMHGKDSDVALEPEAAQALRALGYIE